MPVAVLVGRNTASAAELLAGDLEDYRIGRLFGETTAGCFGTSRIYRLPDGSGVWITVSALQTGIGHRDVHRVGLEPAVTVLRTRADMASGRDPVVDRAVEWLRSRVAHLSQLATFSSKVSQNRWNRGQKSRFHGVCTLYLQFGGNLVADMVSFARPQA